MIQHLTIRNFKRFQSAEVQFLPFTVLMGENGSGKTTILQALAVALRSLSSTDLLTYNPRTQKVVVRAKAVTAAQLPGLDVEKPADVFYGRKAHGGRGGGTPKIELIVRETNGDTYRLKITTQFGAYAIKCSWPRRAGHALS